MEYKEAKKKLDEYQSQLKDFRKIHGEVKINTTRFFLFGMGDREKLIYESGSLKKYPLGEVIFDFKPDEDVILPSERSVVIISKGKEYEIVEDEYGVWINDGQKKSAVCGTDKQMTVPDFEEYPYPMICRVMYHEILFNIIAGRPTPSYGHYRTAWYRDGALIAMCLKKFGNLSLIENWVLNLDSPYDFNRGSHIKEPDNLGEAMYLISAVSDSNHPLVPRLLEELKKYEVKRSDGTYLDGVTDSESHPLYITKWAKYGLQALGLEDNYIIPTDIKDNYSELFWMDFNDADNPGENINELWPYLTWASNHYHKKLENCWISDRDFPLTWEGKPMSAPLTAPHTWHAAEALLYLTDSNYPAKRR